MSASGSELAELIAEELSLLTLPEREECLRGLEQQAKREGNFSALRAIRIYKESAASTKGPVERD